MGKLGKYTFSTGVRTILTAKGNYQYIHDETDITFDRKAQFHRGSNSNMVGAGKQISLVGFPPTLAGQCFSEVVTGGCLRNIGNVSKLPHAKALLRGNGMPLSCIFQQI